MSEKLEFFLLLIEKYAYDKGLPTAEVLRTWDEHGATQEIYDGYWVYHQEAIQNDYADIESLGLYHAIV